MNEIKLTEYRIQRLKDAIDHVSDGNKSDFGRRLNMKDGAFIRQMLAGKRPITEKTIRSIEAFHGMDGWFDKGTDDAFQWPAPNQLHQTLFTFRWLVHHRRI